METKTIIIILLIGYLYFMYTNPDKGKEYIDVAKDKVQSLTSNIRQCPTTYEPVCANNIIYDNSCLAEKAGFTQYTQGECS